MPSGTTITAVAKDNTETNSMSCEAEIIEGDLPVPDSGPLSFPSIYKIKSKNCSQGDEVRITATTPNGKATMRLATFQ